MWDSQEDSPSGKHSTFGSAADRMLGQRPRARAVERRVLNPAAYPLLNFFTKLFGLQHDTENWGLRIEYITQGNWNHD